MDATMESPDGEWITIAEAARLAGCAGSYIRKIILANVNEKTGRSHGGIIEGWRVNARLWLVSKADALAMSKTLSWKAGRPRTAKKPAEKPKRKSR
jgi:hypothetical protein